MKQRIFTMSLNDFVDEVFDMQTFNGHLSPDREVSVRANTPEEAIAFLRENISEFFSLGSVRQEEVDD